MFRLFFLLSFSFILIACNKTTSESPEKASNISGKPIAAAVYPHTKDFFKLHGSMYVDGKAQCLACHGSDGSGGNTKVSCVSCHQNFPHADNWVLPTEHSKAFLSNPQSCSVCHGQDWQGGKSGVSCSKCHQGIPHPMQWATPGMHGKAYVAAKDKNKDCLHCHDPENKSSLATRCDGCHAAFPHPPKFDTGGANHKIIAKTFEGKCLSCHRGYKENMPNWGEDGGCLSCHSGKIEIHWVEDAAPTPPPTTPPTPPKNSKLFKKVERLPSSPHKNQKQ